MSLNYPGLRWLAKKKAARKVNALYPRHMRKERLKAFRRLWPTFYRQYVDHSRPLVR